MRGCVLRDLGRRDEAVAAFRDVVDRAPTHAGALIALGIAAAADGRRDEARERFEAALRSESEAPDALVNVAHMVALDEPERARALYERALAVNPKLAEAHRGLTGLYAMLGDAAAAERHRGPGFGARPIVRLPYYGEREPIEALVLCATDGGNIPIAMLLDDRTFGINIVYPEVLDPSTVLPPHRLIVNAIGDAERGARALPAAAALAARSGAATINPPPAVARTTRVANAERLRGLVGAIVPRTVTLARSALAADAAGAVAAAGLTYPLLLRAPGHQMGRYLRRVDRPEDLPAAVAALPGETLLGIAFVDVRASGGAVRKYRAMIVGAAILPLHLAIGDHWKVHYFSAPMAEHPERRAEEERFLNDMPAAIGPVATAALDAIREVLGLDYAGVDFGLTADRELVVFEANAAMTAIAPDADARWDYRRAAAARVRAAIDALVRSRLAHGEEPSRPDSTPSS